jgi:hypothetical protein
VNLLFRVFAIAVQDGIRQSLTKRQLDREFRARVTVNFPNLDHQLIDEGRDRVDFTLHRKLQLQFGPPRIESAQHLTGAAPQIQAGVAFGITPKPAYFSLIS